MKFRGPVDFVSRVRVITNVGLTVYVGDLDEGALEMYNPWPNYRPPTPEQIAQLRELGYEPVVKG